MSDVWFKVTDSGQLAFMQFSKYSYNGTWSINKDIPPVLSILKYEDDALTVKTLSGEIKKLELDKIKTSKMQNRTDPFIIESRSDSREMYTLYGFLYLEHGHLVDYVHVKEYNTMGLYVILSDDIKVYYTDLMDVYKSLSPSEHYCMAGKLKIVEYEEPFITLEEDYIVIRATSGELYAFDDWAGIHGDNCDITLMVNGDSALYKSNSGDKMIGRRIYTEFSSNEEVSDICFVNKQLNRAQLLYSKVLIDIPDVVRVVQTDETIKIITADGTVHDTSLDKITMMEDLNVFQYQWDINYYVGESGELFDGRCSRTMERSYEINGLYYNHEFIQYPIVPNCKIPVNNGCILLINTISKIGGTLIINGRYAVLSKFAMEIENISLNRESDIFPLKITTKKGDALNAALFGKFTDNIDDMAIVFESGDVWPLVDKQSDSMYSPDGPYSRVPESDITYLRSIIYIIRGNYVMFSPTYLPGEHPTTKIYESFGNFMIKTDKVNIGEITIHKPHTHTKPAVA